MRRVLVLCALAAIGLGACDASTGGPAATSSSGTTPGAGSPSATAGGGVGAASPGGCSGKATPAQTEGPYFKAGSPARADLVDAGMTGTRLDLSGSVFGIDCKPIAAAVLDFWQADASGNYDNNGYRLRGHATADSGGRYLLHTIIPGEYPGRTEHIHVKVTPAGGQTLTTQLYFPGVARNQQDGIFDSALLVALTDAASGKAAAFDFVLKATS
jgi:protocatechuate 3,4-dioxygenase beta subunit